MNTHCKHCGGLMLPMSDNYGKYLMCIPCGQTIEITKESNRDVTPEMLSKREKEQDDKI